MKVSKRNSSVAAVLLLLILSLGVLVVRTGDHPPQPSSPASLPESPVGESGNSDDGVRDGAKPHYPSSQSSDKSSDEPLPESDSNASPERSQTRVDADDVINRVYGRFVVNELDVEDLPEHIQHSEFAEVGDLLLGVPDRDGYFRVRRFAEFSPERQERARQAALEMMNMMIIKLEFMEESVRTGNALRFESRGQAERERRVRGLSGWELQPLEGTDSCYLVNYQPLYENEFYEQLVEDAKTLIRSARVGIGGSLSPRL